jgi:putative flippase GtrA
MEIFKDFAKKHPKAAKWIREGGLFFLFSNLVTVWQYILIQFLPSVFSAYRDVEWMWPGVKMELFGAKFTFNILGYSTADGGMAYFIAYLIATFTAQCINFPLQRNITFRSHGKVLPQIAGYFVGWIGVTLVVNSINSIWVGVAGALGVPNFIYNILTTLLIGGVSMVIFFIVNKMIFPEEEAKKKDETVVTCNSLL